MVACMMTMTMTPAPECKRSGSLLGSRLRCRQTQSRFACMIGLPCGLCPTANPCEYLGQESPPPNFVVQNSSTDRSHQFQEVWLPLNLTCADTYVQLSIPPHAATRSAPLCPSCLLPRAMRRSFAYQYLQCHMDHRIKNGNPGSATL